MGSHLFFSQLALCVLVWLFIMVHLPWPQPGVTAPAAPAAPEPIQPKRHRSTEPTVFEGLTHKPPCALYERDTVQPKPLPPARPDPMPPTHRRPRVVDTSRHCCPHPRGNCWGWLGLGNLRAKAQPHGGPWRQFHWTSCGGDFLETYGTLSSGKHAAVELIVRVLACLAEGQVNALRADFFPPSRV
jgi:hypothetical protein